MYMVLYNRDNKGVDVADQVTTEIVFYCSRKLATATALITMRTPFTSNIHYSKFPLSTVGLPLIMNQCIGIHMLKCMHTSVAICIWYHLLAEQQILLTGETTCS